MSTTSRVEPLSRAEFEQLSADERSDHVQNALTALRESIPHDGAAAGPFIDRRLYVQELLDWAPTDVQRLWPLHRPGIERNADEIHAAFRQALDSGSLSPAQAQFAKDALEAERRLVDVADEYI
jgi:hypothetical protein